MGGTPCSEHSTSRSTSSNVNGGESDLGGNCGYGGICGLPRQVRDSKPERTRNLEPGTKWSLPDDNLLPTAAAFQVTKDDVTENVGDDYETLGTLDTGENRVRGLEFSVVGNVTDEDCYLAGYRSGSFVYIGDACQPCVTGCPARAAAARRPPGRRRPCRCGRIHLAATWRRVHPFRPSGRARPARRRVGQSARRA